MGVNKILTCDLHSNILLTHLKANFIFRVLLEQDLHGIAKSINNKKIAFVYPDAGSEHRNEIKQPTEDYLIITMSKTRNKDGSITIKSNNKKLEGYHCYIIDDIVDSGATLIESANHLLECGADDVCAIITHPVFSGKALNRINKSAIKHMYVSDFIPLKESSEKITVMNLWQNTYDHILSMYHEQIVRDLT